MALTPQDLGGASATSGTSLAPSSVALAAGDVMVAAVAYKQAVNAAATIADTAGLTWVSLSDLGSSVSNHRLHVWVAPVPTGAPATTTVTISSTQAFTRAHVRVLKVPGGDAANVIGSAATGQLVSTYPATPAAGNLSLAICGVDEASVSTQPGEDANYTHLSYGFAGAGPFTGVDVAYTSASAPTVATFTIAPGATSTSHHLFTVQVPALVAAATSLTATGALSARAAVTGSAGLAAVAALSADGHTQITGGALLQAAGNLNASGQRRTIAAAVLQAFGSLLADATIEIATPTPSERTVRVGPENRTVVVAAESRVVKV